MRIGILAVQGDFARHCQIIAELGYETLEVRRPVHLEGLSGLIIPGGESTTFQLMLSQDGLRPNLQKRLAGGMPVWGTCAGAVLLGHGKERPQPRLSLIDVEIVRNAYGRQVDSFVANLKIKNWKGDFPGVFIRAPRLLKVGSEVEVLAEYNGEAVMARQGKVLITSFHPELTSDFRIHKYFIETVCSSG